MILRAALMLLLAGTSASGHRLDEYLQATLFTVEKDRVHAQIRLLPGVAVLPIVLGRIDNDANETISEAEQGAYAEKVLRDLSLTLDGERLRLRLKSRRFPKVEEMKQGLGEIQLEFDAEAPRGGTSRRLIFENHHQNAIAAYLVNCLAPGDPDIRIMAQDRNYEQSYYRLDFQQSGGSSTPLFFAWFSGPGVWAGIAALLLSARIAFLWRGRGKSIIDIV